MSGQFGKRSQGIPKTEQVYSYINCLYLLKYSQNGAGITFLKKDVDMTALYTGPGHFNMQTTKTAYSPGPIACKLALLVSF